MAKRIGIVGAGRMGSGLARGYAQAGHDVVLGSRSPDKAKRIAGESGGDFRGGSWEEAADAADIVVLAMGFRDAVPTVQTLGDMLDEKIVIDITNPFGAVSPGQTAGIEHNAEAAPAARWVAAYKTTFWKTLNEPALPSGEKRDVLVCSDDEDAKRTVIGLIDGTGFRAVDCGGLENARVLDLMVPLMIELDDRYARDAHSSWKIFG